MKHFYSHLVQSEVLYFEIDKLAVEESEKKQLKKLVERTVHFTIMDVVLSELQEPEKKDFLKHALSSDHATTWYFLKTNTTNLEQKIAQAAERLLDEFYHDVHKIKVKK